MVGVYRRGLKTQSPRQKNSNSYFCMKRAENMVSSHSEVKGQPMPLIWVLEIFDPRGTNLTSATCYELCYYHSTSGHIKYRGVRFVLCEDAATHANSMGWPLTSDRV